MAVAVRLAGCVERPFRGVSLLLGCAVSVLLVVSNEISSFLKRCSYGKVFGHGIDVKSIAFSESEGIAKFKFSVVTSIKF